MWFQRRSSRLIYFSLTLLLLNSDHSLSRQCQSASTWSTTRTSQDLPGSSRESSPHIRCADECITIRPRMLLHTQTQMKHRGHLCRHARMSGPAADVTNVLLLLRLLRSGWLQIAVSVRSALASPHCVKDVTGGSSFGQAIVTNT